MDYPVYTIVLNCARKHCSTQCDVQVVILVARENENNKNMYTWVYYVDYRIRVICIFANGYFIFTL